MGWFWGNSNKDDPVKKLDPELRQFLEHETPSKYTPTTQVQSVPEAKTHPAAPTSGRTSQPPPADAKDPSKPSVPAASLFPDGRYAHLWKTYKPPNEAESGSRGVERVIEQYKQRKDTVHRAAMENCALEQEALTYCFQTGDLTQRIKSRMTMCAEENRKFSRCFTTQAKFLQALGYAAAFDWDEEREERIQMHADKLYHQMLDYEKQADDAKAAGLEPPPLTSLFNPESTSMQPQSSNTRSPPDSLEIPGGEKIPFGFKPSKSWSELTPHERELEIRAHNAQLEQQNVYKEEVSPFIKTHDDARVKRREKAVSWFGETIGKWIT